jgi:F-type H+-transporting ATPase subunit b
MIWTVISFFILLFFLRRFTYKPLLGMMQKREATIRESIEEAKRTRESAEELHEQYRKLIVEARDEAKKIIDEGKSLGEKARKEMVTRATEESDRVITRAQEEISLEKERALSELRERIADLSIMAASKVIEKSLSKEDHIRLLEQYVSQVGEIDGQ